MTQRPQEELPTPTYGINKWVFATSVAIILTALAFALITPSTFSATIGAINGAVVDSLGWYYVALVTGFVVFCLVIAFSRLGTIRLGEPDEKPQYRWTTWFAMLFAAGMGIGLVFFGAAEPLAHLAEPVPGTTDGSLETQARRAMTQTFLHWGVHAWAIYAVVALAIAYSVHRKGRPVSIRWALEPLLGKRVDSWIGNAIDVAAVVGTLFGVATSLGFGINQITAGLEHLGLLTATPGLKVILIAGITLLATISVVSGLDKGIAFLSRANLWLAAILLVAVLVLGPTLFILRDLVGSIGGYLQNFISLSFQTLPFYGDAGASWLAGWTTNYWAWWISWSPFVGVFIARISRGRTVREFITGVLLVPTLMTIVWFSVLGGSALHREIFGGGGIIQDGAVNSDTALFDLLATMPGAAVLSGVAITLVVIFFVTSADSGAFVVDMLANGGNPNPPVWSRVMWSAMSGAIAAVLIWAGANTASDMPGSNTDGMAALQALTLLAATPFSLVMVAMAYATLKALRRDHAAWQEAEYRAVRRELISDTADHVRRATEAAGRR